MATNTAVNTLDEGRREEIGLVQTPNSSCPECGAVQVVRDNEKGEVICASCGLVLSDHRIDTGPEWRAFTSDERDSRSRTGAPAALGMHDKGLSTVIDWRDRDGKGGAFSAKQRAQIYRLRKWQIRTRVHSSLDRNLAQAMTEIDRLSSQLGLSPALKEHAARMYRKLIAGRLWRSRSIDATAAAAVYAACRHRGSPRSIEEIAEHSRENKKKISAHYRMLVTKLKVRMPISSPEMYVPRFISELNLSSEVQRLAIEILDRAREIRGLITGRDPRGLAAAAIYVASIMTDTRVTQRDISEVSGVTEVTIRNRYKELVSKLKLSMAPEAMEIAA
ncbi:transcription initiation factor IIB [Candidatus Thorarchaeota archaeon]|nr:MAG: transcription initiation factor IIB [Candidatus Thorarchaeota archaeon]